MRRFFLRLRALWNLSEVAVRNEERGLRPVAMTEPLFLMLAEILAERMPEGDELECRGPGRALTIPGGKPEGGVN